MKNNTFIILIVIAVILIIVGLIIFFASTSTQEPPTEEVVLTEEEWANLQLTEEERQQGLTLAEKEEQLREEKTQELESNQEEVRVLQIKRIIDRKVKFPVLSADKQSLMYYDDNIGEFYRSGLDGLGESALTNASFENLYNVSWSPGRKKIVLTFSSDKGKTRRYNSFDLSEQKNIEYGSEYQKVTASFDGDNVAYIYEDVDSGERNLSVAKSDLSSWRKIDGLDAEDIVLDWFSNDFLAAYNEPSAYKEGKLEIFDVGEGKDNFTVFSKRWGLSPKFSPDGKKVLFNDNSTKNARYPILWVSEIGKGVEPRRLQVSTLVEKCTWASDSVTVFCGVPENYSNFYIQPDDYYDGKFISQDSFYKINTDTKEQDKIADATQFKKDYDVYSPFISDDSKDLFFLRKHDGKLYELVIP